MTPGLWKIFYKEREGDRKKAELYENYGRLVRPRTGLGSSKQRWDLRNRED